MAKVEFYLSNGSYSGCRKTSGIYDTVEDLGMEVDEWESMSEEERTKVVVQEMEQYIEIWYEEKE